MKKTLSIILCAIMLVCSIPLCAGAAEPFRFEVSGNFDPSDVLVSGTDYIIPEGVTMTVRSGMTLYIPSETTLTVEVGGRLVVNGNIVTQPSSQLQVKGTVVHGDNISGQGKAYAEVRFPDLSDASVNLAGKVQISYCVLPGEYDYLEKNVEWKSVGDSGDTAQCNINEYLFIKAVINEATDPTDPDYGYDKYDDSLLRVFYNGVGLTLGSNVHSTIVSTSGDITYSKWTNDRDFYNAFNIYLPTGEGYTVYGRYGETSADTETVKLKYGEPFSFRVEIDEAYDMSAYEVYIYNGYGFTSLDVDSLLSDINPAKPDEFGFYTIEEVKGPTTIYVIGVVKNSTINLVGNIVDMLKNAFEMIKAFFENLFDLFNFGG